MKRVDNTASEMIPMRLVISMAVIAVISFMVAFGYNSFSITLAENQVENECNILESKLYTMVGSGVYRDVDEINASDGTKRTHTFDLPDNLMFLAFGVDPDPDNDGNFDTGLTSNGSVIFYRIAGSNKQVIWFPEEDFKFREGKYVNNKWIINNDEQGFIFGSGGKTTLTFELVEKNHAKCILIHSNDGMEN